MKDKGLKSLDDIRVDPVAQRRLALIGEIRVRQAAIAEKLKRISDIHEMVLIELKRFDNQDAMVRIAESKAELASLATLLRTSKELLDEKSGTALLGESERIAQGEAWFNNVWAGNEGKRAEIDRWTPYRTKGNMWTSKVTRGGGLTVNYINVKVTDVTDDEATCTLVTLTELLSEIASTTEKIALKNPENGAKNSEVKTSDEKIRVEAGEFDCIRTECESGGITRVTWFSKSNGLLVKEETSSVRGVDKTELVAFTLK